MKTLKLGKESLTNDKYKMLTEKAKQKILEFSDEAGDEEAVVELPDGLLLLNLTSDEVDSDERWSNFNIQVPPSVIGFGYGVNELSEILICPSCFEETTIAEYACEFYDCKLPKRKFDIELAGHVGYEFWYRKVNGEDEARKIAKKEAKDPSTGGYGDYLYSALPFENEEGTRQNWVLKIENLSLELFAYDFESSLSFKIDDQFFQLIHARRGLGTSGYDNSFEGLAGDKVYVRKKYWKHIRGGYDGSSDYDPRLLKTFGSFNFEVCALSYDDEPVELQGGDDQEDDQYYYFDGKNYKDLFENSWFEDDEDSDESDDDSGDVGSDGEETTEGGSDDETYTGKVVLCRDGMVAQNKSHLEQIIRKAIEEDGTYCDLNYVDVSNIKDMSDLFCNSEFDGDISGWNVSNVTNMSRMFKGSQFNGDICNWDVSSVTDMTSMFEDAAFYGDISNWNIGNVKNMKSMFLNSAFDSDISKWNVGKKVNTADMFKGTPLAQNNDLPKWYK